MEKRGQRCVDVEGTFGQLKHNKNYKRFLLRGLEKVDIELGLLGLGMNIAQMVNKKRAKEDGVCPKTRKKSKKDTIKGLLEQKTAEKGTFCPF